MWVHPGAAGDGGVVAPHVGPRDVAPVLPHADELAPRVGVERLAEDERDYEELEEEEVEALGVGV